MTSPCVDAGSGPASQSTVAGLTTRTDHLPDEEALDIGFHYGKQVGPKPYLELHLRRNMYYAGEDFSADALLLPNGTILLADVYLHARHYGMGDFYLTDNGWVSQEIPWLTMLPIVVLPTLIPEYYWEGLPIAVGRDIRGYDLSFKLALTPPGDAISFRLFLELRDSRTGESLASPSQGFRIVPNAARYGY